MAIVQQLHAPQTIPTDTDHHVVLFPTRHVPTVPAELPARSAGHPGHPAMARELRARTHSVRQVTVLEVAGRLTDVVKDLDQAIQLAVAEGPGGVVCDLSVVDGAEPGAVQMLATAGRHVRDWPGIPVAVACPDPQVRLVLDAHPLGRLLIVRESAFSAVSAVLATPVLIVERLRLPASPSAPHTCQAFVTRVLNTWQLDRVSPLAALVASELVATSTTAAGTEIDLSVTWNAGMLRLTVRDHGPALQGVRPTALDPAGRELTAVDAGRSPTFGVLPTADGGNVRWVVLQAPRQTPSNTPPHPNPAPANSTNATTVHQRRAGHKEPTASER